MTKTAKQILERVYNKGFNDRCQQEKDADIDNQFVFALSVDQALKELEAIHQQEIAKANKLQSLPMSPQVEAILKAARDSESKIVDILFDGEQYQIIHSGSYVKPEVMDVSNGE